MLYRMIEEKRDGKRKDVKRCLDLAATQGSLVIKASSRQNVLYCTKQLSRIVLNVRTFSSPPSFSKSDWPSLCTALSSPDISRSQLLCCDFFKLDSVDVQLAGLRSFNRCSTTWLSVRNTFQICVFDVIWTLFPTDPLFTFHTGVSFVTKPPARQDKPAHLKISTGLTPYHHLYENTDYILQDLSLCTLLDSTVSLVKQICKPDRLLVRLSVFFLHSFCVYFKQIIFHLCVFILCQHITSIASVAKWCLGGHENERVDRHWLLSWFDLFD